MPGGSALAGTFSLEGSNTYVPLTDISGSTIALVQVTSPRDPVFTTFTYDPMGTPTLVGSSRGPFCGMAWSMNLPIRLISISSHPERFTIRIPPNFR